MIWFWLSLAIIPTVAVLIMGGLLVDRWWWRRKAKKRAEAQAAAAAAHLAESLRPFGEALLSGFRQLAPVMNDAAKSIGKFNEAFRAVPDRPEPDPEAPTPLATVRQIEAS